MKKIVRCVLALFLIVAMQCGLLTFAGAAETGTYVVTADQTQMISLAGPEGTFICNVYKGTVVEVTEVRLGYGYVYRKSLSVGGWIPMADLRSVSADYTEDNIVRIEVTMPDKLTYIVGEEEFDKTGLKVWAVYADNNRIELSSGYSLSKPVFDTIGEKTIIVSYTSFSSGKTFFTQFSVSVEKVPIRKITLEGNPPTQVTEGMSLAFDGLVVRVQFLDGREDRVYAWNEIRNNPDFTITVDGNPADAPVQTLGAHTVRVSYMYPEYNAAYTVTAVEKQASALEVIQLPFVDFFYSDTRKPDLNGLILRLVYSNGSTETISYKDCEIVFDPQAAVLGDNTITVRCKGVQTQITMKMVEAALLGIEIAAPGKTVYIQDAVFDGSDTVVNGIYESGKKTELSNWEVVGFDTQTCGVKTVEIRFGEFSDSFTIYVTISGYLNGDADLDGKLTAADARMLLRHSVGLDMLSGTALFAADRDGDGAITAADARQTLRAAVGLDPVFVDNTQGA